MSFEENIQKWVTLDNQIKMLNDKLKELRENKNSICNNILQHVDEKNLENATVKISDGKLQFTSIRQTQSLTLKYVHDCLIKCIGKQEQVDAIMKYIKESRDIKYIPDIKRTYQN
jgi:hypothetical protein